MVLRSVRFAAFAYLAALFQGPLTSVLNLLVDLAV